MNNIVTMPTTAGTAGMNKYRMTAIVVGVTYLLGFVVGIGAEILFQSVEFIPI